MFVELHYITFLFPQKSLHLGVYSPNHSTTGVSRGLGMRPGQGIELSSFRNYILSPICIYSYMSYQTHIPGFLAARRWHSVPSQCREARVALYT